MYTDKCQVDCIFVYIYTFVLVDCIFVYIYTFVFLKTASVV
jgi:hypothetical protein